MACSGKGCRQTYAPHIFYGKPYCIGCLCLEIDIREEAKNAGKIQSAPGCDDSIRDKSGGDYDGAGIA